MLPIDLRGKRAFVAGVADDGGFGFAIAKALAEAGATVCIGTWPPALGIFEALIERGKIAESLTLRDGSPMVFEKIYPLDAAYDTMDDVPAEVKESKRYRDRGDFTIAGVVASLRKDFGEQPLDIVVHSLANGPEVRKQLMDTSRRGYLDAISISAYSHVAFVRELGPLLRPGGSFVSLSYLAGPRVVPGYGGRASPGPAGPRSNTTPMASMPPTSGATTAVTALAPISFPAWDSNCSPERGQVRYVVVIETALFHVDAAHHGVVIDAAEFIADDRVGARLVRPDPVSYTHLTLPASDLV